MSEHDWMIYGATGYTGRLVAEEAVRRGHRPMLAGRSEAKLRPLADRLGLECIAVSLDDTAALAKAVGQVKLVYHCAGPFSRTSAPIVNACLRAGAHYLDITGEIPVYENIYAYDSAAREKRIALIPGCGMDVIPTECLAKYVTEKVPEAFELEVAFTGSVARSPSPGTGVTAIEIIARGGLERRNGKLAVLPLGQGGKRVEFSDKERFVMPVPWGDLVAAYRSTRVANITSMMAVSRAQAALVRLIAPMGGLLLTIPPIRRLAQGIASLALSGPDESARQTGRTLVWARAMDVRGNVAEAWLDMPEAYQLTAMAGVRAVEIALAGNLSGALTPSQAFGADFVLAIEGTKRLDALE